MYKGLYKTPNKKSIVIAIVIYTIFQEKGTPFVYPLLANGTPFKYLV